jgi:hypothetical protein
MEPIYQDGVSELTVCTSVSSSVIGGMSGSRTSFASTWVRSDAFGPCKRTQGRDAKTRPNQTGLTQSNSTARGGTGRNRVGEERPERGDGVAEGVEEPHALRWRRRRGTEQRRLDDGQELARRWRRHGRWFPRRNPRSRRWPADWEGDGFKTLGELEAGFWVLELGVWGCLLGHVQWECLERVLTKINQAFW